MSNIDKMYLDGHNEKSIPCVFRAETVFHLIQSIIIAVTIPDHVRLVFSLDTTLETAVNDMQLAEIGDVVFEERPKSVAGRILTVFGGIALYPFLKERHNYFGPALNRPLSLLWFYGRSRKIILLNEGRFSDVGLISGRRNKIYEPAGWKRLSAYFVHARNPHLVGAVFTELSAIPRPRFKPCTKEILIDIEAELSDQGSSASAVVLSIFEHQISFDVLKYSTLVVLPYIEILDDEMYRHISAFAKKHGLNTDHTLFKTHPRTQIPSRCCSNLDEGLNIETAIYPIEILLLFDHEFDRAYFIDTSTNLKNIAKEIFFIDTLV
jgi:hypothetical protein